MGKGSRRPPVLAFPLACLLCRSRAVASFSLLSPPTLHVRGISPSYRSSSSSSVTATVSPRFLSYNDEENTSDGNTTDIESFMTSKRTTFDQKQLAHRLKKLSRDPLWPQDHGRKRKGITSSREKIAKPELRDFISGATARRSGRTTPISNKGESKTNVTPLAGSDDVHQNYLVLDPATNFDFEKIQTRKQIGQIPKIESNGGIDRVGTTVVMEEPPPYSNTNVPVHTSIAHDAGPLWREELRDDIIHPLFSSRKRVLVLCTGGTLTMSNDPTKGNSLVPVQGALTSYLAGMRELTEDPDMPEIISHEYKPLIDSSDMGPGDWAMIARDISVNYFFFDGFVILMGTDTMAYAASALSFMLQNLSKPVIFTGSQIPLREPYNDARKNLIMATIFASSDTVSEVCVFFHDRLLRGCRATKVNTSKLLAFDSPNFPPLAEIGINIEENYHVFRPPPRGSFKINTSMDTRLITLRLVPGFDDASMKAMIDAATQTQLKGLVLQLYGTGNLPSLKDDLVQCLANATAAGVVVVATTQCLSGSVIMGHYATGQKLLGAGIVCACDMTVEATTTKLAYLLGRGDLSINEVRDLMTVDLRGEMTPESDLPPPPLASTYQRVIAQKNRSRRY